MGQPAEDGGQFWRVTAGYDLVAVGVADEGAVIFRVVLVAQTRSAVLDTAVFERRAEKIIDRGARRGGERNMDAIACAPRLSVNWQLDPECRHARVPVTTGRSGSSLEASSRRVHRVLLRRNAQRWAADGGTKPADA